MTNEELMAQIEALKAENEKLKTRNTPSLTCKVSQKGALSLYGVGRFPVSLYVSQWERVLSHADKIRDFIAANGDKLARKE